MSRRRKGELGEGEERRIRRRRKRELGEGGKKNEEKRKRVEEEKEYDVNMI
jgi:hypothetical protein